MTINQIKKNQTSFEVLINHLSKREAFLQNCLDEEWDENVEKFIHAFVDLKQEVEETYGDFFCYNLGIRE